MAGQKRQKWGLGLEEEHREVRKVERGGSQWGKQIMNLAMRASQLELRAAQMDHGKG